MTVALPEAAGTAADAEMDGGSDTLAAGEGLGLATAGDGDGEAAVSSC